MQIRKIVVAVFSMGLLEAPAAAQTVSPDTGPLKVAEDQVTRTIDCKGRDFIVTSNRNTLTLMNCNTINVVGDRNQLIAQLLPTSTIAALGNDNHIVFIHAPGFEVRVSSTGKNNEIVPQMNRDLNDKSPVKFPMQPRAGKN